MEQLIANFPKQLEEAIEIGRTTKLNFNGKVFSNVVVSGLGGSGIGGTIVTEVVSDEATTPIIVNKDYFLPAFVNESTLVIISSYSGNTEETVNAMQQAIEKRATVVSITSGGKVIEIAQKNNLPYILIPGGMPPRSCLGYSLTQLFFILNAAGIISNRFEKELEKSVALLNKEEERIKKLALRVAKKLYKKTPIIYSATGFEGVSIRFRQQVNENAKMLCWHNVIPEMNHNELVGWVDKNKKLGVVIFRNASDYSRTQSRIENNKVVIAGCTSTIIELFSKGKSKLENSIYLIHLGDWISLYMAQLRGVDATEVNVIDKLKGALSKI
jgi:glucose/mannose-6-phosphate isomerase